MSFKLACFKVKMPTDSRRHLLAPVYGKTGDALQCAIVGDFTIRREMVPETPTAHRQFAARPTSQRRSAPCYLLQQETQPNEIEFTALHFPIV